MMNLIGAFLCGMFIYAWIDGMYEVVEVETDEQPATDHMTILWNMDKAS